MTWQRSLAITGVWIGVGLVGLGDTSGWSALVALFAFIATLVIAGG